MPSRVMLTMVAVALFLILLAGWYVLIYRGSVFGWSAFPSQSNKDDPTNYKTPTDEQQKNGQTIKNNSVKSGTSGSDQPASPTPIGGSSKSNVELVITHASQANQGANLEVGVVIQVLVNTGNCTLTLTKSGQSTVTQTSDIQAQSSTSTCKGFNISGLATGTWQLTISFDNPDLTGSTTQSVKIM